MVATTMRRWLETQADACESFFATRKCPLNIVGGTCGPHRVVFEAQLAPHVPGAQVIKLADDLALRLGVRYADIKRAKGVMLIAIPNPAARAIVFDALFRDVRPLPPAALLLGISETGEPLVADLSHPEGAHILAVGMTGSGKTTLLKGMIASLVADVGQAVRLMIIDPAVDTTGPFGDLPQLSRPPLTEPGEIVEALRSVVRLMEQRANHREKPPAVPHVVVVVDELADAVAVGQEAVIAPLSRLMQRGRGVGLHVIAATQRPASNAIAGIVNANFPLRVVGRVASAQEAAIATGRAGTGAHLLAGKGEFMAVGGSRDPLMFSTGAVDDAMIMDMLGTSLYTPPPVTLPEVAPLRKVVAHSSETPPRVQEAINRLRDDWPQVRRCLNDRTMSYADVTRSLWDHRYEGRFKVWLDAAIVELDRLWDGVTVTATADTPAFLDIAPDNEGE